MSHPDYDTFSTTIPVNDPVAMEQFQEMMDHHHDELTQHVQQLADELGISYGDAGSIYLLRTRSRWTQELENRLIAAFKAGHGNTIHVNGEEEERLRELGF